MGVWWAWAMVSSLQALEMSVRMAPGRMQFTRTFGPNESARATVMAFRPDFAMP
jgi:hypothetical protein